MRMDPDLIVSLTRRETEILSLLDARLSIKEIATVLHISPRSVERHARSIARKLMVRTQREATDRAPELRLLSSQAPEAESSGESPP